MKKKRILLAAPPFGGHLHPILGIAKGLSSDFEVLMLSTPSGVLQATECGLNGVEVLKEFEADVWKISEPATNVQNNPFYLFRQLKLNVSLMSKMETDAEKVLEEFKPDLVIADFTVPVVGRVAERLNIPWWTTLPSPCVFETPDGPPAYFGGLKPAKNFAQSLQYGGLRGLTRLFKSSMFQIFKKEFRSLGFEAVYRVDGTEAVYSPLKVWALGIIELEFKRSYPPQFEIIGPVLYSPEHPLSDLKFDTSFEFRVLVTLGTHLTHQKKQMTDRLKEIANRHPKILFHFTHGKVNSELGTQLANYREFDFISYDQHLHNYDLVVHHGGSGVLYHCLKRAIPALIFPLDFDQFDNAARAEVAGIAIWVRHLDQLEASLIAALKNESLKIHCKKMATTLSNYDAVARLRLEVQKLK